VSSDIRTGNFFGDGIDQFPAFDVAVHAGQRGGLLNLITFNPTSGVLTIPAFLVSVKFSGATSRTDTPRATGPYAGAFAKRTSTQDHSINTGDGATQITGGGVAKGLMQIAIAGILKNAHASLNELNNRLTTRLRITRGNPGFVQFGKSATAISSWMQCLRDIGIRQITSLGHDGINISAIPYYENTMDLYGTDAASETAESIVDKPVLVSTQRRNTGDPLTQRAPACDITFNFPVSGAGSLAPGQATGWSRANVQNAATRAAALSSAATSSGAPSSGSVPRPASLIVNYDTSLGSSTITGALGIVQVGSVVDLATSGGDLTNLIKFEGSAMILRGVLLTLSEFATGINTEFEMSDDLAQLTADAIYDHLSVNAPNMTKSDLSKYSGQLAEEINNKISTNPLYQSVYKQLELLFDKAGNLIKKNASIEERLKRVIIDLSKNEYSSSIIGNTLERVNDESIINLLEIVRELYASDKFYQFPTDAQEAIRIINNQIVRLYKDLQDLGEVGGSIMGFTPGSISDKLSQALSLDQSFSSIKDQYPTLRIKGKDVPQRNITAGIMTESLEKELADNVANNINGLISNMLEAMNLFKIAENKIDELFNIAEKQAIAILKKSNTQYSAEPQQKELEVDILQHPGHDDLGTQQKEGEAQGIFDKIKQKFGSAAQGAIDYVTDLIGKGKKTLDDILALPSLPTAAGALTEQEKLAYREIIKEAKKRKKQILTEQKKNSRLYASILKEILKHTK
jgi:hypothetical protein